MQASRAASQAPIALGANDVVVREYGPIAGSFPLAPAQTKSADAPQVATLPYVNWFPDECATGGPAAAVCDTVTLGVDAPVTADEVYLKVVLEWEGDSDLDLYLWDNRQLGTSYTEVARSAGTGDQETIRVLAPSLREYNLTILNWAGVNLGYRLTAELVVVAFSPPVEVLEPEFRPIDPSEAPVTLADPPVVKDAPIASVAVAPPALAPAPAPAPVEFADVGAAADPDFAGFPPSSFRDSLAAPRVIRPRLAAAPAPSAVGVLFWLGMAPVVAAATLWFGFKRRSTHNLRQ